MSEYLLEHRQVHRVTHGMSHGRTTGHILPPAQAVDVKPHEADDLVHSHHPPVGSSGYEVAMDAPSTCEARADILAERAEGLGAVDVDAPKFGVGISTLLADAIFCGL